ncbi:MAG: FKBP-type peptidyl-prolyl cis-trans isomerase [Clostridia bacterium]|nr:FKBP-type peptidyl-prolyl cis-trans isomerase [Clostridia bacterium]
MQKKSYAVLALILLFAIVFTSCSVFGGAVDDTTTTSDGDESDYPADVYGVWYSEDTLGALEIVEGTNEAKFYSISAGYYEYYAVDTGTYTYSDGTLILTLNDSNYTFTYIKSTDSLQIGDYEYIRQNEAPTLHASYPFPKYMEMDCATIMELADYKTYDKTYITESALWKARIDIYWEYYESALVYPTIVDRTAQYDDYVNVDFTGYVNDVAFENGSATDVDLCISEYAGYIDGFVDGIVGHDAGDSFDVAVTFPEDYSAKELAGKDAVFKMTLNKIYDLTVTDEQVASLEDFEYETYNEWLYALAKESSETIIWSLIINDANVINDALPEETYLYFYQYYLDEAHYNAHYYGLDYDTYLYYTGSSESSMLKNAKNMAIRYILPYIILKQENLQWTDEDYQNKFDEFVDNILYYYSDYTEEDAIAYVTNNQLDYLNAELTYEFVSRWLVELLFAPEA